MSKEDFVGAPEIGSRWRHFRGKEYVVLDIGRFENNGMPCVVYQCAETGAVWVRPLEDWHQTIWPHMAEHPVPRFRRILCD